MNSFQFTIVDICMCSPWVFFIDFAAFFNILKMRNKSSPQSLTFKVLYRMLSNKFYYFDDSNNDCVIRSESAVL